MTSSITIATKIRHTNWNKQTRKSRTKLCKAHQLILVSRDGDEDGLRENERLEVSPKIHGIDKRSAVSGPISGARAGSASGRRRMSVITLFSNVNARLVLVHTVQNYLEANWGWKGRGRRINCR